MNRINATTVRLSIAVVGLAAVAFIAGCGVLSGWSQTQSVSDPNNLFHFKTPDKWLVSSEEGLVTVYAGDKLPAKGEQQKELALLVMSSRSASETPVPEMIDYLVDARAKSRGWTEVKKGEPEKTKVGGRAATFVDVSAKNAEGKQFDGRYFFVRSNGDEAFIAAIAPSGKSIDSYSSDLEKITEMWYWHGSEPASKEATDTKRK